MRIEKITTEQKLGDRMTVTFELSGADPVKVSDLVSAFVAEVGRTP